MIKIHCDRCGKEIKGTTYYTINIYTEDINPVPAETIAYAAALQNMNTNISAMFNAKKQYCKDCIDKIEAFINNT